MKQLVGRLVRYSLAPLVFTMCLLALMMKLRRKGYETAGFPKEFELQDLANVCTCTKPGAKTRTCASTKPEASVNSQDSDKLPTVAKETSLATVAKETCVASTVETVSETVLSESGIESEAENVNSPDVLVVSPIVLKSEKPDIVIASETEVSSPVSKSKETDIVITSGTEVSSLVVSKSKKSDIVIAAENKVSSPVNVSRTDEATVAWEVSVIPFAIPPSLMTSRGDEIRAILARIYAKPAPVIVSGNEANEQYGYNVSRITKAEVAKKPPGEFCPMLAPKTQYSTGELANSILYPDECIQTADTAKWDNNNWVNSREGTEENKKSETVLTPETSSSSLALTSESSSTSVVLTSESSLNSAALTPEASLTSAALTPESSLTSAALTPESSLTSAALTPESSLTSAALTPEASSTSVALTSEASSTSAALIPEASSTSAALTSKASWTSGVLSLEAKLTAEALSIDALISAASSEASSSTAVTSEASSQTKKVVRKQLPKIPDQAEIGNVAMDKGDLKKQSSKASSPATGQLHLEYVLMSEYNTLYKHEMPGVYVMPSALTPLIWHCVMFIRQGMYKGAIYKFNLNIPENYPNGESPQVFFEQPVFHPLIDLKTCELDVKREFPKWRRNVHYIWQVLMYTRKVFFKIDSKAPWQPEAAELYEQNMELFKQKVVENVADSVKRANVKVECHDPHVIIFSPWDRCVHDEARDLMLCGKRFPRNGRASEGPERVLPGLSWLTNESLQIFSKDD